MTILEIIQLLEGNAIAKIYLGIVFGLATVSAVVHLFIRLNQIKYEARELDSNVEYLIEEINKLSEFQQRSAVIMSKAIDNANENVMILGKSMDLLDDKCIDISRLLKVSNQIQGTISEESQKTLENTDRILKLNQVTVKPEDIPVTDANIEQYLYTACTFPFTEELKALHGFENDCDVCEDCDNPGKAFVVKLSRTDPANYELGVYCTEHYRHAKDSNPEECYWFEFDMKAERTVLNDWQTHAVYLTSDFPIHDKITEALYQVEKFDLTNDEIVLL